MTYTGCCNSWTCWNSLAVFWHLWHLLYHCNTVAISRINSWLSDPSRSYDTGVQLYRKYGNNELLKRVFARGADRYNHKKLVAELRAICEAEPDTVVISSAVAADAVLVELDRQWREIYRNSAYLHSQLLHMTKKDRSRTALQILDDMQTVEKCWDQIDYFNMHGRLKSDTPAPAQIREMPLRKLIDRRYSLRSSISKHAGRMKRLTDPVAIAQKKKYLQQLEAEKEEIEILLDRYEAVLLS